MISKEEIENRIEFLTEWIEDFRDKLADLKRIDQYEVGYFRGKISVMQDWRIWLKEMIED